MYTYIFTHTNIYAPFLLHCLRLFIKGHVWLLLAHSSAFSRKVHVSHADHRVFAARTVLGFCAFDVLRHVVGLADTSIEFSEVMSMLYRQFGSVFGNLIVIYTKFECVL